MLESWKDLYISYPFMPVAEPPEWFKHVKDLRVVVVLPAANIIFKYKNTVRGVTSYVEGNWYAIRAYLTALNTTTMQAIINVYCEQVQEDPVEVKVNLYDWTHAVPSEQSYMLIDSDLETPSIPNGGYELQLDTLLFMQEAPHLTINDIDAGQHVDVTMGHNVNVSRVNDGILFYGAVGTGLGVASSDDTVIVRGETVSLSSLKPGDVINGATVYSKTPMSVTYTYKEGFNTIEETAYTSKDFVPEAHERMAEDKQGYGITNINGMVNSVWIKGTFPVSIKQEDIKDGVIKVAYTEV